jgi:pimeloyl-ACP methyl ester carboxylesterase
MNPWLAKNFDIFTGHFLASLLYRSNEHALTDLSALQEYKRGDLAKDPAAFFYSRNAPPVVHLGNKKVTRKYSHQSFTFASPYQPLSDTFTRQYMGYAENHTVHTKLYRPRHGNSKATVVLLHGWTKGDYIWESRLLIPWMTSELNCTVVGLAFPYHASRAPSGSRFSGEYFVSGDMIRTLEAIRQAVIDTRAVMNWLDAQTDTPTGVIGISLGAFITYLLLCADDRPAFAIPILGHGELIHGADDAALMKNVNQDIQAQGINLDDTPELTFALTALEMRPRIPPERILPINGLYDMVVSPERANALFNAWNIPEVVWLPGGHFSTLNMPKMRHAIQDFVGKWVCPPE